MTTKNIIRAWKDPEYRNSLSASERASLPAHPTGLIVLGDAELEDVAGGLINPTYRGSCLTVEVTCPDPRP